MSLITVGQAVVEVLKAEGVKYVFGIPGAQTASLYDALYDTSEIRHIQVRHEQSASNMATAYAQLTGEPGVCTATTGPGATNLVTGIAEAFCGALPVIALTGRVLTAMSEKGAQQDIPQDLMFAPITKWTIKVERADRVVETLKLAFATARSGKPGPVVVDIPMDIYMQPIEFNGYVPVGKPPASRGDAKNIKSAVDKMLKAKHPIIIAGGGVITSGAFTELQQLAETLGIPVITSLSGRSAIPEDHPLAFGGLGLHRNEVSKKLLNEADFIIGLGFRFGEMDTNHMPGYIPAPGACHVKVDIDPTEMARNYVPDIGIVGDIKLVLSDILDIVNQSGGPDYRDKFHTIPRVKKLTVLKEQLETAVGKPEGKDAKPLHPEAVINGIKEVFPPETVLATDIGALTQPMTVFPYLKVNAPRTCITPTSLMAMGFSANSLPVAKLVHPNRPAVGICGDGSFQMVMNVLPVAVQYKLPVTWCILNDNGFGSIADVQQMIYNSRFTEVDFTAQPDFAGIAKACQCYGEKVEEPNEIKPALARALEANQQGVPAVLDFIVARERSKGAKDYFGALFE